MSFYSYKPDKVAISFIPPTGPFSATDWVSAGFSFDEDLISRIHGTNGHGRHIDNANEGGVFTFVCTDASPDNLALTALWLTKAPFAISIIDKHSALGIVFSADDCRVQKPADVSVQKAPESKTWTISVIKGVPTTSGAKEY